MGSACPFEPPRFPFGNGAPHLSIWPLENTWTLDILGLFWKGTALLKIPEPGKEAPWLATFWVGIHSRRACCYLLFIVPNSFS